MSRVAVIENEEDLVLSLTVMLETLGHEVVLVAREAISVMDPRTWEEVDRACVDVMLSATTTGNVLAIWLAWHAPHVRRIAVTALPKQMMTETSKLYHHVIFKPFRFEDLEAALE